MHVHLIVTYKLCHSDYNKSMSQLTNFFNKVGILAHTPRSGFAFLGSGTQSVAEHTFRMLNVAFILNKLVDEPVDELHLLKLVLFHDLPETRSGDLNYENQKYVQVNEEKLFEDLENDLPYGWEIVAYIKDYETRATSAARIAYDADQLEFLLTVKEELDKGSPLAADWIPPAVARLKSQAAKDLAQEIFNSRTDDGWFGNKQDSHWVNRACMI
jgi:putative hydrolase of HD superfamily